MSKENFKQTIDDFFRKKSTISLSQITAKLAFPTPRVLAQFASKTYKDYKTGETDARYEKQLLLHSWKLILALQEYSLRNLYVLLRSVNNSEHCTCSVCTFAAVWTSMLEIFLKLICHYTDIDHKRCMFGCERSVNYSLHLKNRAPSPIYLHFCINIILKVSTCTRRSCN